MVWPPGQSICFIHVTGFMYDCEIELGKKERPASLSAREFLFSAKVGQIIVVGPDFEGNRVSFKVVAKGFEGLYNGQEFFVMDVVVLFSR